MMQSISIQSLGTSHACIPVFMEGSWFLNTGKDHSLNKNICTALFYRGEIHFFCVKPLRYLYLSVILNEADFCKNNNNLRLCLYLTSVKYIQCLVNHSTLVTNLIIHLKLLCSELLHSLPIVGFHVSAKSFFFLIFGSFSQLDSISLYARNKNQKFNWEINCLCKAFKIQVYSRVAHRTKGNTLTD